MPCFGLCGSSLTSEERKYIAASHKWDRFLESEASEEARVVKLLFLGTGESGKSTLFKQMAILYGTGFSDYQKQSFRPVVLRNVVESMQVLLKELKRQGQTIDDPDVAAQAEKVLELQPWTNDFWEESYIPHIEVLWKCQMIKEIFTNRSALQIMDSASYFFDQINVVGLNSYVPNKDDILRARMRTSGIVEQTFLIHKTNFRFVDVGGQRNERRKWIHCFEDVTSVIFVVAISEYDQVLFEDNRKNRLQESLKVYDDITNNEHFATTPMILFLNKMDLFHEKFHRVPLADYLPEYEDYLTNSLDREPGSWRCTKETCQAPVFSTDNMCEHVEDAAQYVSELFHAMNNESKLFFFHLTCATNTDQVQKVFEACRLVIIQNNLDDLGLE